jgi:hypothetical protein
MTRYDYTKANDFYKYILARRAKKVKDSEGSQLENNYRPLQDLNGRIVTLYP